MKISFLGQGIEPTSKNAVGNLLVQFLKEKKFNSFTGFSAFASEAGIYGLSGHINSAKKNFKNLTIIVGIDQGGTSKEALEEILSLNIKSYIFYQEENPIFHPKFYLFEGPNDVKIILGSSNLTRTGLFTNIESSLLVEFNQTDKDGLALLSELKTYYKSLLNLSDPNIFKIDNKVINDFFLDGIVPDEATRKRNYSKGTSSSTGKKSKKSKVPKRSVSKVPSSIFPSKSKKSKPTTVVPVAPISPTVPVTTTITSKHLVWKKLKLSNSDAQDVPAGTAITGNLKLAQARFKLGTKVIDQKTYFRNQVFNKLTWVKTKPHSATYEETFGVFDISISGKSIGKFTLKLSHDSSRVAGQGNTPTWLHWGRTVIPVLQKSSLSGKTLNLYEVNKDFLIDIV
ncbi:phospholipase D family protein [Kordia sp. YSTF-M3]|uniref:Phospholipase D family protein n=1 Tax=Kordia aestuariivivens TaxID=2759037 RepID=A0ABR7QBT5_9FLAO|nr:phospholipase D family protein [Kordia aestuariivivens]MBC8756025.1 phospholipase D family protein [Kordia aestuariivivens]